MTMYGPVLFAGIMEGMERIVIEESFWVPRGSEFHRYPRGVVSQAD